VALRWIDRDRLGWRRGYRTVPPDAALHRSVIRRLELDAVLIHGDEGLYRPEPLKDHLIARRYWQQAAVPDTPGGAQPGDLVTWPAAVAPASAGGAGAGDLAAHGS
jgi:hypothetical protein